jgi:hypothetical protein
LGDRARGVKNWIADSCSHSLGGERREKIQSSAEAARCTLRSPKKVLGPRVTHEEHSERKNRPMNIKEKTEQPTPSQRGAGVL